MTCNEKTLFGCWGGGGVGGHLRVLFACCHCVSGLPGGDGQPGSVGTPAADPAQQEGHSLWKHARDLQLPQQASSEIEA